jgi:cell division control protein 7
MQTYFRHLFRALRDIHARDIVHRDVKPANFLFDPKAGPDGTGWGVLCDFGLAQVCIYPCLFVFTDSNCCDQRVDYPERTQCLHTAPTKENPHGSRIKPSAHESTVLHRKLASVRKRAEGGSHNIGYKTEDHRQVSAALWCFVLGAKKLIIFSAFCHA